MLLLFLGFGFGGAIWWFESTKPSSSDAAPKSFLIVKGSSAEKVGEDLEKAGIIKSKTAFKVYVQFKDLADKIPPGEFRIPGNLPLREVVDVLLKGPIEVWVTIPEGFRQEQVAERVIEGLELTGIEAEAFKGRFLIATAQFEGFLFPDTYLFPKDITPEKVVEKMRLTFDSKFGKDTGKSGLSLDEVVTLASIIERETLSDEERPIVAGIYLKRLRAGWSLDADATIQYAVGREGNWWPRPLSGEDLEVKSPFNSYKNAGLPPSPICSPGLTSLKAVTEYQDSPYWFYLHDSEGKIHYAKTLEEQNANVNKYLR